MLVGHLNNPGTYISLLTHPVWQQAFAWLKQQSPALPATDGVHELQGHDLRAMVQTVTTEPRARRNFEAHQREIDLQVCFAGSEIIEWAPLDVLIPKTTYDHQKDYTLFDPPQHATNIHMVPGTFAVFFPSDGHRPGISYADETTRKVVIKVNKELLLGRPTILGPYDASIALETSSEATFQALILKGLLDRISSDVNLKNFPFTSMGTHSKKPVWLVNFGRSVFNDDVPKELLQLGFRPVAPQWVLALNATHPTLMDDYIILTTETPWIGREGVAEAICLHKDAGKRRLRTHYTDTNWGPHIWFAAERIAL